MFRTSQSGTHSITMSCWISNCKHCLTQPMRRASTAVRTRARESFVFLIEQDASDAADARPTGQRNGCPILGAFRVQMWESTTYTYDNMHWLAAKRPRSRSGPLPCRHAHRQPGRHHAARARCAARRRSHRLRRHAPDAKAAQSFRNREADGQLPRAQRAQARHGTD